MSSVFGVEQFGLTEHIEWMEQSAAWYVKFVKDEWVYERLMDDDPRDMPTEIKKFYRDDVKYAMEKDGV